MRRDEGNEDENGRIGEKGDRDQIERQSRTSCFEATEEQECLPSDSMICKHKFAI